MHNIFLDTDNWIKILWTNAIECIESSPLAVFQSELSKSCSVHIIWWSLRPANSVIMQNSKRNRNSISNRWSHQHLTCINNSQTWYSCRDRLPPGHGDMAVSPLDQRAIEESLLCYATEGYDSHPPARSRGVTLLSLLIAFVYLWRFSCRFVPCHFHVLFLLQI